MKQFGQLGRLVAAIILSCALSLGVAQVAQASSRPAPVLPSVLLSRDGTAILIVGQQIIPVPSAVPQAVDTAGLLASWNAKLPALKAGLARGESLAVALQEAGLPAITGSPVRGSALSRSAAKGGIQPDGVSCQYWTCGWEFDALSTFELKWLVWVGVITGPGLVCAFFGPPSAGVACAAASAIWGVISAYAAAPPNYNPHSCLYAGVGFGTVSKLEYC
jgi:hypothetical protein